MLKYNDGRNVEIQFLKTGYETLVRLGDIRNGKVKDPYSPSVYGIGVVGTRYPVTVNGVKTKEYDLWNSMLRRCYSDSFKKRCPTYEDCECYENFKYYEYFHEWCNKQIGFGNDGWQLDKDLLDEYDYVDEIVEGYFMDYCAGVVVPHPLHISLIAL